MAAQPVHNDGRKVNVKLILLGTIAALGCSRSDMDAKAIQSLTVKAAA